jgi:hypothetical protein
MMKVVTRPADVIHDLFAAAFLDGFPDARGEGFQDFVPGGALPLAAAARSGALHGIEHAVGVVESG